MYALLVQSGSNHARIRKLGMSSMTPAFIASYNPLLQDLIQSFFASTAANNNDNDEYIEIVPLIRTLFMSIISKMVLGTTDVSSELHRDVEIWARGLLAPPLTFIPWSTAGRAMQAQQLIVLQLKELMHAESLLSNSTSKSRSNDKTTKNQFKGLLATLQQTRDVETGEALNIEKRRDSLSSQIMHLVLIQLLSDAMSIHLAAATTVTDP